MDSRRRGRKRPWELSPDGFLLSSHLHNFSRALNHRVELRALHPRPWNVSLVFISRLPAVVGTTTTLHPSPRVAPKIRHVTVALVYQLHPPSIRQDNLIYSAARSSTDRSGLIINTSCKTLSTPRSISAIPTLNSEPRSDG